MKIKDLKTLIQDLPDEMDVTLTTEGLGPAPAPFTMRDNMPAKDQMFLNGFSLEELKREIIDVVVMEKSNIAIITIVEASDGRVMV